jgi:hypothetical protein
MLDWRVEVDRNLARVQKNGNRKKNHVRREAMHLYPGSIDIVGGTYIMHKWKKKKVLGSV